MALMQKPSTAAKAEQYIGSEEASPEEQMQYEQALQLALTSLHGDEAGDAVFKMVTTAKDIPTGVAKAVVTLIEKVSVKLGGQLQDAVKLEVGEDLVDEILDLLIQSGRLKEADVTDEFVEQIVIKAYEESAKLTEIKGDKEHTNAKDDIQTAQALGLAPELPQGVNAMSNGSAEQAKGLMSRGG